RMSEGPRAEARGFGVWRLAFGVWRLAFGVRRSLVIYCSMRVPRVFSFDQAPLRRIRRKYARSEESDTRDAHATVPARCSRGKPATIRSIRPRFYFCKTRL